MDHDLASNLRVVLLETSHPGNIGAVARAMKTMRLTRLFLVRPKQFPCAEATARAAGADDLLYTAAVCESLSEALGECAWVVGSSARSRHIRWPELTPRACARQVADRLGEMEIALVFGRESSGLTNAELDHCHALMRIPTNPSFSSLNLSAAVQILGYEIQLALRGEGADDQPALPAVDPPHVPVAAQDMEGLHAHLRQTLIAIGYLDEAAPKLLMRRLRKLFNRAQPDRAELNILRGILRAAQGAAKR